MDFFIIEGFRSTSKEFAELRRVTFTGPSRAASFPYIARCVRVIFFRLDSHCLRPIPCHGSSLNLPALNPSPTRPVAISFSLLLFGFFARSARPASLWLTADFPADHTDAQSPAVLSPIPPFLVWPFPISHFRQASKVLPLQQNQLSLPPPVALFIPSCAFSSDFVTPPLRREPFLLSLCLPVSIPVSFSRYSRLLERKAMSSHL